MPTATTTKEDSRSKLVQNHPHDFTKKQKIGPMGLINAPIVIADIVSNPWWIAMHKAEKTGILIAETISRCENRYFILIGHSLGARVAVSALRVLGTKEASTCRSRVVDVHLMGGATDAADAEDWEFVCAAIDGKCSNYHTRHDRILGFIYRAAKLGRGKAIGINSIPTNAVTVHKLLSIECSDRVKGHCEYHKNMQHILRVS
jgi:hypothetical protein